MVTSHLFYQEGEEHFHFYRKMLTQDQFMTSRIVELKHMFLDGNVQIPILPKIFVHAKNIFEPGL